MVSACDDNHLQGVWNLIGIVVGSEPRGTVVQGVHDLDGNARLNFQERHERRLRRPLMRRTVGQCEDEYFQRCLHSQQVQKAPVIGWARFE